MCILVPKALELYKILGICYGFWSTNLYAASTPAVVPLTIIASCLDYSYHYRNETLTNYFNFTISL